MALSILIGEDNLFTVKQYEKILEKNGHIVAEAAQEILEKRPNQRIIFASAYDIGSLLNAKDLIKKSVEIIQKPFSLNSLVAKIQNRK
jgi:two-component system cell cycle response regulator CpdR